MTAVLEAPNPVTEKQKRLQAMSQERRDKEQMSTEERKAAADQADEPPIVPVSRAKMLNLPETVGLAGLRLRLRAIPSKLIPDLVESMLNWPPIIYVASKVPFLPDGTLDVEGIAAYSTLLRQAAQNISAEVQEGDEKPELVTVDPTDIYDVLMELGEFEATIEQHIIVIADTVWMLAQGVNPGIAWPMPERPADVAEDWKPEPPAGSRWLSDMLLEQLTTPDYVRLPLLMLRANSVGGGFADDLTSRFFRVA